MRPARLFDADDAVFYGVVGVISLGMMIAALNWLMNWLPDGMPPDD